MNCSVIPGYAITLQQVANLYNNQTSPPMFGVGNVVTDFTQPAGGGRQCIHGLTLNANWADIANLHAAPYNWRFIDASRDHMPFAGMTAAQVRAESCETKPIFDNHGLLPEAKGLFAYPSGQDTYDSGSHAQPDIVRHCFSYGRKYGGQPNSITFGNGPNPLEAPFYADTYSPLGGKATSNPPTPSPYDDPITMINLVRTLRDDQWLLPQPYRFVSGTVDGDHNCGAGTHYTSQNEEYCWEDWQSVIASIPAGVTVTDPLTVAQNWPGNRDNPQ